MQGMDSFSQEPHNQGFKIDFKRVADRSLRYWYVVVLSLVISLTIAYLRNRYAVRIYPITASVIIKEKEETSGAELLYNNALINPYRNYLNEPYIIRSYPIIQQVVEDLNFEVVFFKEGNIKTTESYGLPVKVKLLKRNGSYNASLNFKALDEKTYSISSNDPGEKHAEQIFKFNDSVVYNGHHFLIKNDLDRINQIKNDPYILTFLDPLSVTGGYVNALKVEWAEEGAGVINLAINGANTNKEIDFLNSLILTYQKHDLEKKNQAAERTIQFIKGQLSEITDSLKNFEFKLQQFKMVNSVDKLDEDTKRIFEKLTPLEAQQIELTIRSNYYDYLTKYIKEGKNLDLVILPSAMGIDDQVLTNMINKMVELQLEIKLFISKNLQENPAVQSAMRKVNELKDNLQESVSALRKTDKIKGDLILKQIGDLQKQIDQLPLQQRQFVSIQRNYSLLEGLYVFLMQKMSEAAISRASNVSDIEVVNPPMQGDAITPNTRQNYTIGFLLGLFIPLGIFVLLEVVNQKIQSKEDIDKFSDLPFSGGIGHSDLVDNMAITANPKSAVAESFRAIRSNLNYFTGNVLKKVFMVSSSISGEGKTFTTINLATVFAMSGRKTLIIGADMRKPKIYSDFNLDNRVGLSGYLSRLNTLQEVIQNTTVENLDLISGGPVPPNPAELLLTDRFGELIQDALKLYDYIIIDTPPLLLVTDAFVLSKYADHTVFVVRQNYTPKTFLRNISDFYNTGKLKNISLILNDIYKSGFGYGYGYGYGYSYAYGYGKKKNGDGYYS